MFAILISEENLPKIIQVVPRNLTDADVTWLKTCYNKQRYFVTGYVSLRGPVLPWAFLPEYKLRREFEYDATKIQTDWDQIVRK